MTDKSKTVPAQLPPGGADLLRNKSGYVIGARGYALMRLETDKHMVTIASTGGGKGRAVIIPNLLTHTGSVVSVEIGGASYKNTVDHRKHVLGQDIHVIDPLNAIGEKRACFNVLDTVDPKSPRFVTDMTQIAASLLKDVDGDRPQDPFWKSAPKSLLTALLIYVKTSDAIADEDRHLPYLAEIVGSYPSPSWHRIMESMATDTGPFRVQMRKAGTYFLNKETDHTGSIVKTISTLLGFAEDPQIADMLKSSSFNLADLRKKKTSLYLVMPEIEDYVTNAALLRLIIERSFAACPNPGDAGCNFKHDDRVLFILDEFTQLGKLDVVDSGMQTARQKGITLWTVFQDIGRLEKLYGKEIAGSFLGAAGCTQIFDVGDERTKQYVSDRVGKRIAYIQSIQHGLNWSNSQQENWSETISHGSNNSKTEGTTIGTTESWNDTISTGKSDANGNTSSQGWSEASSRWTASMLPYPGEKLTWWERMQQSSESGPNRQFGRNSSISQTRTITDTYTKATAKGVSKANSHQSGTTTGTSTQNAKQNGGGVGHQTGGQYTISYQPQILPSLDPSDVEFYLGTDNQQIVFIRASGRVQKFIDFRANWDQIPQLTSYAKGPDHHVKPYPEILPPLLNHAPLAKQSPLLLEKTTPISYGWPVAPTFEVQPVSFTAQKNLAEKIELKIWQKILPHFAREHLQATAARNALEAARIESKAEEAEFWSAHSHVVTKLEPFKNSVLQGEAHLEKRESELKKRAEMLREELQILENYRKKLTEFHHVLCDDLNAEHKLRNEIKAYQESMKPLLALKKRWNTMRLPARPASLPLATGKAVTAKEINDTLSSQTAPVTANIPKIPQFKRMDDHHIAPGMWPLDFDDAIKNTKVICHEKRHNANYEFNYGDIYMEGGLLWSIFGRIRRSFLSNRISQSTIEKARRNLWIQAAQNTTKQLLQHDQMKQFCIRDFKRYHDNWIKRNEHNQKIERMLDIVEGQLNDTAQSLKNNRSLLESRHRKLCEANISLDARRRDLFNNFAASPLWPEADALSVTAPQLPKARIASMEKCINNNIEHMTKPQKTDVGKQKKKSYTATESLAKMEIK